MPVLPLKRNLFYNSRTSRLYIAEKNVISLDIIGIDGRRVDVSGLEKAGDVGVLDLSSLQSGVYIVRLSTVNGAQTVKFVKN